MKKFIVIEEGSGDYFIVDNLEKLIEEMYGGRENFDIDKSKESFNRMYRVIEIEGEFSIKE
jgi:hypothetical protein